jgi:hypothetical protein
MDRYGLPVNGHAGGTVAGSGGTPFLNGVKSSLTCIDDEPFLICFVPKNGLTGTLGGGGGGGADSAAEAVVEVADGRRAAAAAAAPVAVVLLVLVEVFDAPGVNEAAAGFGLNTNAALVALNFFAPPAGGLAPGAAVDGALVSAVPEADIAGTGAVAVAAAGAGAVPAF